MMRYYEEETAVESDIEFGCKFCWDRKRKKEKELFFLDAANNMRICNYCPYCGRPYDREEQRKLLLFSFCYKKEKSITIIQ